MCTKESGDFPGAWGELAELLREAHECLATAERSGVPRQRVVDLSRAARHAVRVASEDVDRAVTTVGRLVLDARSLVSGQP